MRVRTLIDRLPATLAERVRSVTTGAAEAAATEGEFVLYWMRAALRGHENPALDAALALAEQLGVPAFVYQGLSERYPFASDRHHTFILEGVIDVQRQLAERRVGYAFHLERPGHRSPNLLVLAQRAALVVTEDVPVAPLVGWTRALAERVAPVPIVVCDSACVVPMRIAAAASDGRFERAFEYRRATAEARSDRVGQRWRDRPAPTPPFLPAGLPFEPLRPTENDLAELVARCEIDHGVAPVAHTRGGTVAGYRRWQDFLHRDLAAYASRRNDPLRGGASRLSPYLHYGMVSPLRIAREAWTARLALERETGSAAGPQKFLDELLVWRELAWTFCYQEPRHASLEALPAWARATLLRHRDDRRQRLLSWEELALARSGDPLWDAAQRSLLRHGELHNNVRMTWGKALLEWTSGPDEALAQLEDLNHRYALDGRDPSSWGGILWCLGQFDRPFLPEREVFGTVRPRPLREHARRLDVDAYSRMTAASPFERPARVLVIGAGIAGMACARLLHDGGLEVQVVDKGRGPGGRASTRRVELGGMRLGIDHGAQYFTARDPHFERHVRSWQRQGVVAPWRARMVRLDAAGEHLEDEEERWVGAPGMSRLVGHLGQGLEVEYGARVSEVRREDDGWLAQLEGGRSIGPYDVVLSTLPAPQARDLLSDWPELVAALDGVEIAPCWAVLLTASRTPRTSWDGARVDDGSPLAWIARNASKPDRGPIESWVLHAGPEWSRNHLEASPEWVREALLGELERIVGLPPAAVTWSAAHRWRHARVTRALDRSCVFLPALRLGLAGDWCLGPRIEAAWLSGVALAGRVMGEEVAWVRRGESSARPPRASHDSRRKEQRSLFPSDDADAAG